MISRRSFLSGITTSLALAGYPLVGRARPGGKIAVILLEGGMDGIAAVPPVGDPDLVSQRETLISSAPIMLDGFFAMHPSMPLFANLFKKKQASIVHATSIPYVNRSHFEGQNVMESGNKVPFSDASGWLGRALETALMPGEALALDMPLILRGTRRAESYYPARIRGGNKVLDPALARLLARAHDGVAAKSFADLASRYHQAVRKAPRDPVSLAAYAGGEMARPDGPSAAVIRVGQFDTHAQQGKDDGAHFEQLGLVDSIFDAFRQGLGGMWTNSVVVTLTEFGRTVKANGSDGTDHGYGTAGLLAGGLLAGGKVVSDWPGLASRNLFERRDLAVTIDYRSVLAACVERAFGLDHDRVAQQIFYQKTLPRLTDTLFS